MSAGVTPAKDIIIYIIELLFIGLKQQLVRELLLQLHITHQQVKYCEFIGLV